MATLHVVVVTPEKTAVDATADFAVVPLFDGELGIGSNHTPLIGKLGHGELRLKRGNETTRYYLDEGFVQVRDNTVVVLTGTVSKVEDIDVKAAQEQLEKALAMVPTTDDEFAERDRLLAEARAQLHASRRHF
ncbi:MAG TPA: ATP synthase F1 subunit epsilon [Planctomycetaceae bacterium]|nr:ATP synthase F1 subunit epsilon [Planctomycetaceae bacterium]